MNDGTAISAVYGVLAIVLVGSSLVAMRLPVGKAVKMALAWVAIFGVAFALFTFRSEFKALGNRLHAAAFGGPVALAGGEMRVDMAEDGHFWVRGEVNGTSVRFFVDSGATTTTLSAKTAAAAGVAPSGDRRVVNTANGQIIVHRARVASLTIGSIERNDFPVDVTNRGSTDILGMNFLSSLDGWRVENGELVLRP